MGESSLALPSPVSLLRDWLCVKGAEKMGKYLALIKAKTEYFLSLITNITAVQLFKNGPFFLRADLRMYN